MIQLCKLPLLFEDVVAQRERGGKKDIFVQNLTSHFSSISANHFYAFIVGF